ncbi:MAG: alpha/beta hydrolase, partial [Cytophagales bacterium]
PLQQAKNFKTPIYLGHSKQDNIVPINQTQLFYEALKKNQPKLKVKLNLIDGGHDYKYWNKEVENILQFFGEF